MIYKDFFLTAMVYFLFQNFPKNLQKFVKENSITYRDFLHSLKDASFWYKNLIFNLIPMENKKGRKIVGSEVQGAMKYLENIGKRVNIINVAEIVGCCDSGKRTFRRGEG